MVLSWVVCHQKPFLQLIVKCLDWFTKTQSRTMSNKSFLPPSQVNPYPVWFHVVDDVEMLNYEGLSAMPPVPTPSSYSFRENTFAKCNFAIDLQNIKSAKYKHLMVCVSFFVFVCLFVFLCLCLFVSRCLS